MRLLLDTHALLWWLNDDYKLENHARRLIADAENDVLGVLCPFGKSP